MKSKFFGLALSTVLLALCFPAQAQQPKKVPKIGYLTNESGTTVRGTPLGELFLRRLHELGYVEGKNIAIEYRSADDKLDRLPALAGELVRLNVDVLVTVTTPIRPSRQERYQDDSHRFYSGGRSC